MKTVIVREFGEFSQPDAFVLDLRQTAPKHCTGCWNCWVKTPGRCLYHDLDDFHRAYLAADEVVFYIKPSLGFVSSRVKTLFDRMIPHFLPYIGYHTGESMHVPRYSHYPNVTLYYQPDFASEQERQNLEAYLQRTFYQFMSPRITVLPLDKESGMEKEGEAR